MEPPVANQDSDVCCGESGSAPAREATPLTALLRGQCGVLSATDLEPGEAAMLRAMGLRPRVRLKLCQLGEPCIVEICCGPGVGSRVALHRALAERVRVVPQAPGGGGAGARA